MRDPRESEGAPLLVREAGPAAGGGGGEATGVVGVASVGGGGSVHGQEGNAPGQPLEWGQKGENGIKYFPENCIS